LPIDHNRLSNNPLLTANSRGSTGAIGVWFWGSVASFVPKAIGLDERVVIAEDASEAIELQVCQGRSRPVLDSRGIDQLKFSPLRNGF
jgi:hypothetical protein